MGALAPVTQRFSARTFYSRPVALGLSDRRRASCDSLSAVSIARILSSDPKEDINEGTVELRHELAK